MLLVMEAAPTIGSRLPVPTALLRILVVLLVVPCTLSAYPVFGTKRYGRSTGMAVPRWSLPAVPLYHHRTTRTYPYYEPYSQDYMADYFYPGQEYYPSSFSTADKYPNYQSLLPYYYAESRIPYYYGYDEASDPVDDLQEEILQEDRDERGDYGQETWYENQRHQDSNADANAIFLQNLILAQMYNDAAAADEPGYQRYPDSSWEETATKGEDEDVKELKELVHKKVKARKDNIFSEQLKENKKYASGRYDNWQQQQRKRSQELKFTDRKPSSPVTTPRPKPEAFRGQKEVVLPRPDKSGRTSGLHEVVAARSRQPTVYDTIRQLLLMQEQLAQEETEKPRKQKRSYTTSEDSLVEQLGSLKKYAV